MEAERKIIQMGDVSPSQSKKGRRKRLVLGLGLAVLAAGLAGFFALSGRTGEYAVSGFTVSEVTLAPLTVTTEASGSVVLPRSVTLVSPQEGYASVLSVQVGDQVSEGEVLAELRVPELLEEEYDLLADLENARLGLEELIIEYRYQIAALEESVERAAEDLAEAEEDLAAAEKLAELRTSREADREAALDTRDRAREVWDDAVLELSRQRELEAISLKKQNAVISQTETALARLEDDMEDTRIKSPLDGQVLYINEDLSVPGSLILFRDELVKVADTENPFIDLEVYEQYASELQAGNLIDVTVGSATFSAEIVQVGKLASLSSDGLAATVSVRARPVESADLTSGASAVAVIPLGTRTDAMILPRGAYLTTGSQKYVYKIEGDGAVKTEVTFGTIQGSQVQVLSGLEPGDRIITSGYQNFIDQKSVVLK
jgi:HlyD family secretion protein